MTLSKQQNLNTSLKGRKGILYRHVSHSLSIPADQIRQYIWAGSSKNCTFHICEGWGETAKTIEPRHDKTIKVMVRPAKTQIGLASAQSDQSSLCAQWVAKGPSFLHADSEDSDQSGRMPRLIWVFGGRTLILLFLSCRGSIVMEIDKESHLLPYWVTAYSRLKNHKRKTHRSLFSWVGSVGL